MKREYSLGWVFLLMGINTLIGLLFYSQQYSRDDKYCDLNRIIDKKIVELNPIFYDMESQAEQYIGGESITGKTVGTLHGWSGDFDKYVCWYEFTIKKGEIIERIEVQHIFYGDELIKWRNAVDEKGEA